MIGELDELYLKDESSLTHEAYETLEKFLRPHEMSIRDYVIKFKQLYKLAKSHEMKVLDGVAYRLLNKTNLPEEKEQLVRANVKEIKYKIIKKQLKNVFIRLSFDKGSRNAVKAVKFEQSNFAEREHNENVLYGKSAVKNTLRNSKNSC